MTIEPYAIEGARQRFIDTNGVRLSVYEAGKPSDPTVVFSHGFPELGYSWRYQVPALAAAGFHVRRARPTRATARAPDHLPSRTTTSCTSPATWPASSTSSRSSERCSSVTIGAGSSSGRCRSSKPIGSPAWWA